MYTSIKLGAAALLMVSGLAGVTAAQDALSDVSEPKVVVEPENATYPQQGADVPWPTKAWPELDGQSETRLRVEATLRSVFKADDDVEGPGLAAHEFFTGGRGIVVIHKGVLVGEAYREGFGPNSRFISWSQAKSITQSLVGIAVGKGLLDVDAPVGFSEWQGDARAEITLDDLLRMSSGLKFEEGAGGLDDNSQMMFGVGHKDQAAYAASLPLLHEPGTHWAYATGTTMMVSRAVRDAVAQEGEDPGDTYYSFIREALLDPLGMKSAVPEFDAAGTFLGGTLFYATTRDYARFGMLYLRDGIWEGTRILPGGWVDYTRSPTSSSKGDYGTHFWLGTVGEQANLDEAGLSLPDDMFQARGMGGQFIAIIPSRDVVIAYNGYSNAHGYWPIDLLFAQVLADLGEE
jgi:CubicO group peptidase (beta-lactamase class C family)